jgi:formylglycine-generating enzyme required for sulfatase activity
MTIGCGLIPAIVLIILLGAFFYVRSTASNQLTVPDQDVVLVRTVPDEAAPLLARFGHGQVLTVTGRSHDWRWLEVALWGGRRGWTLRPLDILVWQIEAQESVPVPDNNPPERVAPIEAKMISLPATTFTMGSPPGLGEADEQPAHAVSLSAFAIDRTEVTVGQYWQCVEAGSCAPPDSTGSQASSHYFNDPAFDNHPIVNVPWTESNRYCLWRGKRLPTEAEWEMAAGWDIEREAKLFWPWGNTPDQVQANLGGTSIEAPATVGSFFADASPSGILDMAGNVSEWVFDWYKVDAYSNTDDTDPIGPANRRGEGSGRVVRGGSFADWPDQARTANRRSQEPAYGFSSIGFRCARNQK